MIRLWQLGCPTFWPKITYVFPPTTGNSINPKEYFYSLIPFVAGWTLLLLIDTFAVIGLITGLLQSLLFSLVECLPIWMTSTMSYGDIGWALGLTLIGVLA